MLLQTSTGTPTIMCSDEYVHIIFGSTCIKFTPSDAESVANWFADDMAESQTVGHVFCAVKAGERNILTPTDIWKTEEQYRSTMSFLLHKATRRCYLRKTHCNGLTRVQIVQSDIGNTLMINDVILSGEKPQGTHMKVHEFLVPCDKLSAASKSNITAEKKGGEQ